nr:hypothetical protein [Clostridia bacterium]
MEQKTVSKVTLTQKEAEEYCTYKRQKKISEIMAAMRRTESEVTANDSAVKLCEQAVRLRQAAVKVSPADLMARGEVFIRSGVKIDCIVGGNGETFASVKAYEAKKALKAGAKEITLILTPSFLTNCRYTELRKEIKKVRRAARRAVLKVRIEKNCPLASLERLARICSELGAQYFSLPYFAGCERLQAECSRGCLLEVSGIESLPVFKEMAGAGMGRMIVKRAWELYSEWLKEVEQIVVEKVEQTPPAPIEDTVKKEEEKEKEEKDLPPKLPTLPLQTSPASNPQTNYRCRLEGSDLKFL